MLNPPKLFLTSIIIRVASPPEPDFFSLERRRRPFRTSASAVSYEDDEGIRPSWWTEHGDRMRSRRAGERRLSYRIEHKKSVVRKLI